VKQLTAIWFSLLILLAQIAPAAAVASSPDCCRPVTDRLVDCCAQMPCCAAKPAGQSQPAPVAPIQNGRDTQISVIAPVTAVWVLPGREANAFSSAQLPPIALADTPLYTRHCALLL
jgi:hypothetical protein